MAKEKKEKAKKEEKLDITFADLLSKIVVTKKTPDGLLAEWQKNYGIDNCQVILKNK
jgi:hypothetical protein